MRTFTAFCLALVLTMTVTLGCAIVATGASAVWQISRSKRSSAEPNSNFAEDLQVDEDGRVSIRVSKVSNPHRPNASNDRFLDINREPIARPAPDDVPEPVTSLRGGGPRLPFNRVGPQLRAFKLSAGVPSENWYFVYDDRQSGHARFEMYDVNTRRLVGVLGIDGFGESPLEEAEMFVIDGVEMANRYGNLLVSWDDFQLRDRYYGGREPDYVGPHIQFDGRYPLSRNQLVLPAEGALFLIDFAGRNVKRLLPEEKVLSVEVARLLEPLPDDFKPRGPDEEDDTLILRQFLAARTPEKVILLHPIDGARSDNSIPGDLGDRSVDLYLTADGGAVFAAYAFESRRRIEPLVSAFDMEVWSVTPDGKVTRKETVTLHERVGGGSGKIDSFAPLALPAPLLSLGLYGVVGPYVVHMTRQEPFGDKALEGMAKMWPAHLLIVLLATGLAYAAHRHRTAHRLPRSSGWIAFVFLFGLPGFFGYLLHRRWPVRDPAPPPQRTGAEVFG